MPVIATDWVAWSVCVCVSIGHVREPCKNVWTHAVWGPKSRGFKEPFIRWRQGRTNPFAAARGDKKAMRSFVKIPWPPRRYANAVYAVGMCLFVCPSVYRNPELYQNR